MAKEKDKTEKKPSRFEETPDGILEGDQRKAVLRRMNEARKIIEQETESDD